MSVEKLRFSAKVVGESADRFRCDALVVPVFKGSLPSAAKHLNKALDGIIQQRISRVQFDAESGKTHWIEFSKPTAPRILLVGLGERKDFTRDGCRNAYGSAAKQVMEGNISHVGLPHPGNEFDKDFDAALEGFFLGTYRFDKYLTQNKRSKLKMVSILVSGPKGRSAWDKNLKTLLPIVQATFFARDLVNEPANIVTPDRLAAEAKLVAKTPNVKLKIFEERELKKRGMNLIMAVGQGSQNRPKLVHLEYKPRGKAKRKVALVGKGVTFDTGGLSLKDQNNMYGMKLDMAGAGAVLATMWAVSTLKLPVHLHSILPLVENSVSATSTRPGDVIVAHNKKSVEIENTDAEGRLILADAVSYASSLNVDEIVDCATLTGACVIALGEQISGLFTHAGALGKKLRNAGEKTGEKIWELPLEKEYAKLLKSDVADLKNVAGRWGSAITAALFISEFASGKAQWAHIDLAGPAYLEREGPTCPKGATGYGVRLFTQYLSA